MLLLSAVCAATLASPGAAGALRVPIEHVDGTICDVNADKILYAERTGGLAIKDRASSSVTPIPPVPNRTSWCGSLSPHGAVFRVSGPSVSDGHLYDYRDGALIDLGFVDAQSKVVGSWLIWSKNQTLYRRDLELGLTVTVSTDAGNTANDVDLNGNVVFWSASTYQINRFDGTSTTQLTHDASLWNTYPITDGVNIVYSKHAPCCSHDSGSVAVYTAAGEIVLDSFRTGSSPAAHGDYEASGGWVAFTRRGPVDENQVWLRSPSGTETRISPAGLNAWIVAMSPGAVLYGARSTYTDGGDYYLGAPGAASLDLGDTHGGIFWTGGSWYETAGGTLYRLDPNPDPYPRPKGATPLRVSLVPAYRPCTAPNSSHGAPLAFGSCNPPQPASQYLTLGTPDSNGLPPRSTASVLVRARVGNPNTWANEGDAKVDFSYTDVFKKDLSDYTGELQLVLVIRRTDRDNPTTLRSGTAESVDSSQTPNVVTTTSDHGLQDGDIVDVGSPALQNCPGPFHITVTGPRTFTLDFTDNFCGPPSSGGGWAQVGHPDPVPATGQNFPLAFTVPCAGTPDPTVGSDCTVSTSADALQPGLVNEGDRSIWQVASVRVFDGGSDGIATTTGDNTLFATEGLFVP